MQSDHSALIAKLEAATEGSREFDAAIFCMIAPGAKLAGEVYADACKPTEDVWFPQGPRGTLRVPPAYTSSLDAALTLVPEGWDYCISRGHGEPAAASLSPTMTVGEVLATAPTPALALCIAALKARATPENPEAADA